MGTNFYFLTKDKEEALKLAPNNYTLTDEPFFGYEIHIAKTSAGWLPLFQGYVDGIKSVKDLKESYERGKVRIFDEYGNIYSWPEFDERVLKFNGGVAGVKKRVYEELNPKRLFYDKDMPNWTPVSHFEYGNGKYRHMYYKDSDGYEFCYYGFS